MDRRTQEQLHAISVAFYEAHAQAFDASRVELPWPGWDRLLSLADLRAGRPLRILDIGCGNGRFGAFLADHLPAESFEFVGTDANAELLAAGQRRVGPRLASSQEWSAHDFLRDEPPGSSLPPGPFDLIVLMGVLHHVPGADQRMALLRSAAARLGHEGVLAFTAWQFLGNERLESRRVDWALAEVQQGFKIDRDQLEAGDTLLRFGDDATAPPRYCHQVSDQEFESWPPALDLKMVADYRADGAAGDLNRYMVLRPL